MKESYYMEKIRFKRGITLIEVIVSMMLILILSIAISFIIPRMYSGASESKETLDENIFIENSYKMFTSDPYNFKENIDEVYSISLLNNAFTPTMFENIELLFYEDDTSISVIVKYKNNEVEKWVRKKVIQ